MPDRRRLTSQIVVTHAVPTGLRRKASDDFCATDISLLRSEDQKYLPLFKKFSIYCIYLSFRIFLLDRYLKETYGRKRLSWFFRFFSINSSNREENSTRSFWEGHAWSLPIVFHKYTCTALSVELLDNVRKSTLYSQFFL